jgi:hypothetical protein
MDVKVGSRWKSAVCSTQIIIVRAAAEPVSLACGGHEVVAMDAESSASGTPDAGQAEGSELGKRYTDEDTGIEVLCIKAGAGSLTVGGRALQLKKPKSLPASD